MNNFQKVPENLLSARKQLHQFQKENQDIIHELIACNGKLDRKEHPSKQDLVNRYFQLVAQVEVLTRHASKELLHC
ncbi:hypothetical protein BUE76_22025 [Cnuella takakiae]|nr:hypothetical protein BUE76_22025 [Cnuella takakiae]